MYKTIGPNSQDFAEPQVQLVKSSRRGLLGADRQNFVKRASARFADQFDKLARHADETLIHLIAIGATEAFGANRNGDGFKRAACRNDHDTFRKYARWYRNHRNTDPAKSYGLVKLAFYNEPMARIELLVALNGSKEAAARNDGLVADLELDDLNAGRDIGVSMGAKVAHDVCSYCGNKASKPDLYCDDSREGGFCKAGGLKNNMGAIVDIDGGLHHLHADNPSSLFYDISRVFRPADRTAYVLGMINKTANAHGCVGGAKMASLLGVSAPYNVLIDSASSPQLQGMLKAASLLAQCETAWQQGEETHSENLRTAFAAAVQPLTPPPVGHLDKQAQFLRALADERIMLPLPAFLTMLGGCEHDKLGSVLPAVRQALPGVYRRLLGQHDVDSIVGSNPYVAANHTTPAFSQWAQKHASLYSLAPQHAHRRAAVGIIRDADCVVTRNVSFDKTASDSAPAARVAEEYALYQIGFLSSLPQSDNELPLTASLGVLQNHVR